jgi:hypothetical protein
MPGSYLIDGASGVVYSGPAFEWIGMERTTSWPVEPPDATFGPP